jgi:hypothetical protein
VVKNGSKTVELGIGSLLCHFDFTMLVAPANE